MADRNHPTLDHTSYMVSRFDYPSRGSRAPHSHRSPAEENIAQAKGYLEHALTGCLEETTRELILDALDVLENGY